MAAPGAADKFVKNFPWQKFAGRPGALADALGLPNDDMIRAWAKKSRRQGRLVDDVNWRKEIENHHNLVKKHKKKFEQAGFDIEKYTEEMTREMHRLKSDGIHTGPDNWNKLWDDFGDKHHPTDEGIEQEVLKQLDWMRKQKGLPPWPR